MRNNRLNAALVRVLFILGALFGLIDETSFIQKAFAAGPDVFYAAEEVSDMLQEEGDSLSQNPENNLLGDISDRNKWFYPHLSELYEKGLLDGAVSLKPDSPVEEEELVDLLAKVLFTKGKNFEAVQVNEGGTLNRGRMASLLAQAARVAGLETPRGTV